MSHIRFSTDDIDEDDDGRPRLFTPQPSFPPPPPATDLNVDDDYFDDEDAGTPSGGGILLGSDYVTKPVGERIWENVCAWVPILAWLPAYEWREDFLSDLIAGLTVSTVLVPQSMAYSLLAELPPVYGLYTSLVPIALYAVFGTSRHMATGTFALTALLLGHAAVQIMKDRTDTPHPTDPDYFPAYIAICLLLTFLTGAVQIVLGVFKVGHFLTDNLLPDSLVIALNTAASYHIATSQLKHILGLSRMPPESGTFGIIHSFIYVGTHIDDINWITFTIGASALICLEMTRRLELWRKNQEKQQHPTSYPQGVTAPASRSGTARGLWGTISGLWQREGAIQLPVDAPAERPRRTGNSFERAIRRQLGRSAVSLHDVNGHEDGDASGDRISEHVPTYSNGSTTSMSSPKAKIYFPIPDVLLIIVFFTALAKLANLNAKYGVAIIGVIPQGLPSFGSPLTPLFTTPDESDLPSVVITSDLLPELIRSAFVLALVSYIMSISIAKQFARKFNLSIDADQEMLSLGIASLGGSFFSAYVYTGSLTRTAIVVGAGSRSQLANMFSVLVVLAVLVLLTPLFEVLPQCVLGAVVLAACWKLMANVSLGVELWRDGTRASYSAAQRGRFMWDCVIFWVTFVSVVFINVEGGLLLGICIVLLRLMRRAWKRQATRKAALRVGEPLHGFWGGRRARAQDWARNRVVYDNPDGDLVHGREEDG